MRRTGGATEGICTRRAWPIEARAEPLLEGSESSVALQEVPDGGGGALLTTRDAASPRVAAVLGESEGRWEGC